MKKPEKQEPTFYITARIKVDMALEVQAENLDAAFVKAKELKLGDFIEFNSNQVYDTDYELAGVSKL